MLKADGPFWIIKKMNNNAYKIDLSSYYNGSSTFNIKNLTPYLDDDNDYDLRTNHF